MPKPQLQLELAKALQPVVAKAVLKLASVQLGRREWQPVLQQAACHTSPSARSPHAVAVKEALTPLKVEVAVLLVWILAVQQKTSVPKRMKRMTLEGHSLDSVLVSPDVRGTYLGP